MVVVVAVVFAIVDYVVVAIYSCYRVFYAGCTNGWECDVGGRKRVLQTLIMAANVFPHATPPF